MANSELNFSLRERLGKGGSRTLRREGMAPAVVYGKGLDSCSIIVSPKELKKAIGTESGENALITLKGEGHFDGKVVILKDLTVEPIRREIVHADFLAIDLKSKLKVMVPVVPIGTCEGEKLGGQLQIVRHELEVLCLPTAIPNAIEIDVTEMVIGDVFHVEDVTVPEGSEISYDINFTVLTVVGHKEEEEVEEGEEVEVVEGEEADAEDAGEED